MKGAKMFQLIKEGEGLFSRGDVMQASEESYKVVEEGIKTLAEKHKTPEHERATRGRGRGERNSVI